MGTTDYYLGAAFLSKNYFGNGELGTVTFANGSASQSGEVIGLDSVLTTGSEAGGGGASSYGTGTYAPSATDVYEFTVANKDGSYDGDMFVAQFAALTVDAGQTVTVDAPNRGLFIYVTGNCTINGILSMSCRGGFSDPTAGKGGGNSPSDDAAVSANGIRLPMLKSGQTDTLSAADFAGCGSSAVAAVANQCAISGNGQIFSIAKTGAVGGVNGGAVGANGVSNQSGGGGAGYNGGGTHGQGAAGTCFSGGTGGGGKNGATGASQDGQAYGGAGGYGLHSGGDGAGGGGGHPGGALSGTGTAGSNGTGGLLILVVGGTLTFGASSSVISHGADGGGLGSGDVAGGGSSGGGNILILHAGTLTDNGVTTACTGAPGGDGDGAQDGGAGGNGVVQGPTQVDAA